MRRVISFRRRRRVKFSIRTKRNPNKIGSRFGKIQNDYPLKIRTALGGISTSEVRRRRQDCASLGRAAVRRVGRRRTADIAQRYRNIGQELLRIAIRFFVQSIILGRTCAAGSRSSSRASEGSRCRKLSLSWSCPEPNTEAARPSTETRCCGTARFCSRGPSPSRSRARNRTTNTHPRSRSVIRPRCPRTCRPRLRRKAPEPDRPHRWGFPSGQTPRSGSPARP